MEERPIGWRSALSRPCSLPTRSRPVDKCGRVCTGLLRAKDQKRGRFRHVLLCSFPHWPCDSGRRIPSLCQCSWSFGPPCPDNSLVDAHIPCAVPTFTHKYYFTRCTLVRLG